MFQNLKLGTAFGIDLFLHWTFWLMPGFVFLSAYISSGPAEAYLSLSVVLALFACVMLHELGHALMARYYGIGTKDITLYPIGGVARLHRMSERPSEELMIALAGPAVNVVIASFLAVILFAAKLPLLPVLGTDPFIDHFLNRMLWLNVGLVVFNMLPAFPMDGGRVLRSLLAMLTTRLNATRVAVAVGGCMAALFVAAGLGLPLFFDIPVSPLLPILGIFIFFLGQQELAMIKRYEESKLPPPARAVPSVAMMPIEEMLGPDTPRVDPNFTGYTLYPERGLWVEWRDGQPIRAMFIG